jgi:hypothetical protein
VNISGSVGAIDFKFSQVKDMGLPHMHNFNSMNISGTKQAINKIFLQGERYGS